MMRFSRFLIVIAGCFTVVLQVQADPAVTMAPPQEMQLKVTAKKRAIKKTAARSSTEIDKEQISQLPQGENITLPKLLATTNPGIVQGAFGQTFIRGNHANIQYQIDGVQLPDSPSNTFGEAFSPRNIDHMEVITGGVPAEYGERLAAVVNIVTRSGSEEPGGTAVLSYGSYNTFAPWALYGGSNANGDVHYFFSAAYSSTDRGLDTPQPLYQWDQTHGGPDAVHDKSSTDSEFAKIDWQKDNSNKLSVVLFKSYGFFQIPNYPSSFSTTDQMFNSGYTDAYGNGPLNYTPPQTDDTQEEQNVYSQFIWKHTLNDHAFMQLAPYVKYSYLGVGNDPDNDLSSAYGSQQIVGSTPSSFSESRAVLNGGLKFDYTDRLNEAHLLKTGLQVQTAKANGSINVISGSQGNTQVASTDNSPTTFNFESVFIQDDYTISKTLSVNMGLRFDATQTTYGDIYDSPDSLLQPRLGLNYMITDSTKLHLFYGKLFQPAPAENLRDTFVQVNAGNSLAPHDIYAEKDDYYEIGLSQEVGQHVVSLTYYYKDAVNQLDDTQLLNTSIAQPYNFDHGFANGLEFAARGQLANHWSDFFNYTYSIAKGRGVSGGLFAFKPGQAPSNAYQYLDHVQITTANAGVTYSVNSWLWTITALYGSGLRTGPNNTASLPTHLTADTSVSYAFQSDGNLHGFKVSGDILNIMDDAYPITIANGYNGSHYAGGREYFARLARDF